ncbi:MAG: response regulator [Actinomycetota bacterium]
MVEVDIDSAPPPSAVVNPEFGAALHEGSIRLPHEEHVAEAAADVVVVLSDINMPGMSGLDLLAEITREFPDVEVYMVTAYDDNKLESTALQGGARGYLTKPIDFGTLKGEVFGIEPA